MSTLATDIYPSLDSKSNSLLIPEGEHLYRQRFQNMKLVVRELQDQLAVYKNRCSGVDTVAFMLKESKLEVQKLTRQCKALETAVANLQNRLSKNNLPSSVNIEEADRFVPGASKQTLDNLAKENARLRSQLKSNESQTGGKASEEEQSTKEAVDSLEAENRELQSKIDLLENMKLAVIKQYETVVEKLSSEKKILEEQLNQYLQNSKTTKSDHHDSKNGVDAACQTREDQPNVIEEFRRSLKMFSAQCVKLDSDLGIMLEKNVDIKSNLTTTEKVSRISEENYADLEQRLKQVIIMNQRWQAHNDSQEQQVHLLGARIAELEEINQEMEKKMEMERSEWEVVKMDNARLKRDIDNLTRETLKRQHAHFDTSIVEILKQQIQVCTEDFNTERKDREQAVNRAKILQDENNRLNQEIVILKQNIEVLRPQKLPTELTRPAAQVPAFHPGQNLRFRARGDYVPQKLPQQLFPAFSSTGTSLAPSISPVTSPVPMSLSSSNLSGDRSSYAPSSQENPFRVGSGYPGQRGHLTRSEADYSSLPRSSRSSTPDISSPSPSSDVSNISMPMASRKGSVVKSKGEYITCPKCNQEFSPDQDIIAHIDKCNA